ncbi:hypothetical protein ACP70R_022866 [Stipagrostis hirtigluma subsp. patula]
MDKGKSVVEESSSRIVVNAQANAPAPVAALAPGNASE